MRARRALAVKHAHADGPRSGFLQSFDLAEANQRGEFIAFANHALGSSCAAGHGAADQVLSKLFKVSLDLRFESCLRHKSKKNLLPKGHRGTRKIKKIVTL